MPSRTKIVVTGATGYIGGAITSRLLGHPQADSFDIVTLVHSKEKATKIEALGIRAIISSYSDLDKLEDLASETGILFSIVDCDNLDAMKANIRKHKALLLSPT